MAEYHLSKHARLSVAPMMDWTDRHCRYFHRLLSSQTLLYTEMVTAPALVRGKAKHLLQFNKAEHPVALQLGGSDPSELMEAALMGEAEGYSEINLNVGCPSDRVQSGTFGALLMKTPEVVARCVEAMQKAVSIPVTVKCRIGVDDQNPKEVLPEFLRMLQGVGVSRVAVHARKAWLQGLSPKQNRDLPPLDYEIVRAMKDEFPDLHLSVNGGVETLDQAKEFLAKGFDGVMIGRAAYNAPWDVLGGADTQIFGVAARFATQHEVVEAMLPYIQEHLEEGGKLHNVTRHMMGLFLGCPGARAWRRTLSEGATKDGADSALLMAALAQVPRKEAA